MLELHEHADGVTLSVRVQPRARRNVLMGEIGGALKIALTALPVDGRANQACVELLAELFDLPKSAVTIVSGERGRKKIVRLAGISAATARAKLAR